ncbi:MAG: SDR family NAD(P)-dependent oxidoreductase [Proteobacteria bacterium]|nr:SDR family NAD(P)-dependent oxidoreductase [Pseudomonadota bacterium]
MSIKRFVNKTIVVTGGARGIGRDIAFSFAREGGTVIVCDINEQDGVNRESEIQNQGMPVEFLRADLSQRSMPQEVIRQVVQKYGGLDILVNNARSGRRTSALEEDEDSWEEGISVTLRAAFFSSQEAIRFMSQKGGGNIVNICSIAANLTSNEAPIYHIAKAGMLQMTRYFAAHAGKSGIRVNAVLPGFIIQDEHMAGFKDDSNKRYREIAEFCHPLGHTGCSGDVSNAVLFLCSPEASFITGQNLIVDGGLMIQEQSTLIYRFDKEMQ